MQFIFYIAKIIKFINNSCQITKLLVYNFHVNTFIKLWFFVFQTISYTSPRGGVSVVEERGETTTSFLLLQNARSSDSGTFACLPSGMQPTYINMHVLEGQFFELYKIIQLSQWIMDVAIFM